MPRTDYSARLEYNREWRQANREKVRSYNEQSAEYRKAWHAANPGKYAEYKQKLRYRDPAKYMNRRVRSVPWADKSTIRAVYAVARAWRAAGVPAQVDHIVPLYAEQVCGLHVEQNLTVTTEQANKVKSNRWWPDKA